MINVAVLCHRIRGHFSEPCK